MGNTLQQLEFDPGKKTTLEGIDRVSQHIVQSTFSEKPSSSKGRTERTPWIVPIPRSTVNGLWLHWASKHSRSLCNPIPELRLQRIVQWMCRVRKALFLLLPLELCVCLCLFKGRQSMVLKEHLSAWLENNPRSLRWILFFSCLITGGLPLEGVVTATWCLVCSSRKGVKRARREGQP